MWIIPYDIFSWETYINFSLYPRKLSSILSDFFFLPVLVAWISFVHSPWIPVNADTCTSLRRGLPVSREAVPGGILEEEVEVKRVEEEHSLLQASFL